jgi:succinate-semialdehyde dehydrogenase/glutarate-semialdehyde dehydrogenase
VAYSDTQLFINGKWRPSQSGRTIAVLNPATEETIGTVAHADRADLDEALEAAAKGFKVWRAGGAVRALQDHAQGGPNHARAQ